MEADGFIEKVETPRPLRFHFEDIRKLPPPIIAFTDGILNLRTICISAANLVCSCVQLQRQTRGLSLSEAQFRYRVRLCCEIAIYD